MSPPHLPTCTHPLYRYAGRKVMLGVDRLDMIKGIPQKLLAFEKFLEEHPQWRDKVGDWADATRVCRACLLAGLLGSSKA